MYDESSSVHVSYFVLCDQVITEANTSKQSLIGIYSAITAPQIPFSVNVAVAIGLRVTSPEPRVVTLQVLDPAGNAVFSPAELPFDWNAVKSGLLGGEFATLQIHLNLQMMPINAAGLYRAQLMLDGQLISQYLLSVVRHVPQPVRNPGAHIN